VTDRHAARPDLPRAVEAAVAAGVDWVQLRERDLGGAALFELGAEVATAARAGAAQRGGTVRLLVNRRVDVALALGADGVHLGFDAMPPQAARELLGPEALLGLAAHAAAEAAAAAHLPVDYVQLAPVFAPLSKPASRRPLGLHAVRDAAGRAPLLLAQGGVEPAHAAALLAAGAGGVAVTGAILGAPDPAAAAAALRRALDG
jgi:thiamine-phosphate pyrophosphorylase